MRILTITSSYPKFEGDTTAPFVESIAKALVRRGHTLTVVLPARSDLSLVPIPGVRFRPYRYAPAERLEVFGYAEALKADVAVRWATYAVSPLAILRGALALRTEARRERYDVVHAHWVVPNGATARLALGSSPLPLVVSLHGSDVFLSERKSIFRRAARIAFAGAAAVTACSEDLASRSLAIGARMVPTVIPYGVDTETFRPDRNKARALRRSLGLDEDGFVALAVGRLVRKKGFEYLVDAAAELSRRGAPVTILIAGRGDLKSELESRARGQGVGSIGKAHRKRRAGCASELLRDGERRRRAFGARRGWERGRTSERASRGHGFGIRDRRVGGRGKFRKRTRAGREALLVPEKSATALAEAIDKLSKSTELAGNLGSAARRRAEEAFLLGSRRRTF